jgi:beta-glucanase (GH16 family)
MIFNNFKLFIHINIIKFFNFILEYIFIIRYKLNLYNPTWLIEYDNNDKPTLFIEEFNNNSINSIWKKSFSWGEAHTGSLSFMTPFNQNHEIKQDRLYLINRKEEYSAFYYDDNYQKIPHVFNYTCGMITSELDENNKGFEFLYGKIEAKVKLANAPTANQAFWLLKLFENDIHEIDIFEYLSNKKGKMKCLFTLHGGKSYKKDKHVFRANSVRINLHDEFLIFSLEWRKNYIKWYINDILIKYEKFNIPDNPMMISCSCAINSPEKEIKNEFPFSTIYEYIKVYK